MPSGFCEYRKILMTALIAFQLGSCDMPPEYETSDAGAESDTDTDTDTEIGDTDTNTNTDTDTDTNTDTDTGEPVPCSVTITIQNFPIAVNGMCQEEGDYCEGGAIPPEFGALSNCEGELVCCLDTYLCEQLLMGMLSCQEEACDMGYQFGCPNQGWCCYNGVPVFKQSK